MIGVYRIYNILNNKSYIGSSVTSIENRLKRHFSMLNKGNHHSKKLELAWKKYAVENFKTEILESFEIKDIRFIRKREEFWIEKFNSFHNGYNSIPTASGHPDGELHPCYGRKLSNEHKTKIGIASSINGKGRKMSVEQKEKLKAYYRKNKGTRSGVILSKETKNKISENNKGKKRTAEQKLNYSKSQLKLSDNQVLEIVDKIRNKNDFQSIANQYFVSVTTIVRIKRGLRYAHITGGPIK